MNPHRDISSLKPGLCPTCGRKGKSVKPITLQSLLRPEFRGEIRGEIRVDIGEEMFSFCESPECTVAYFGSQGTVFSKNDLTVRIGIKESASPRTI